MNPSRSSIPLVIRNRAFGKFLSCHSITLLGTTVFDFTVPLYVFERTRSVSALSMVVFCQNLPFFLMAPVTAYFADNFNKRFVFFLADISLALCLLTLLGLEYVGYRDIWPVLSLVFIAKFLATLSETMTIFQLVPAMVGTRDLSKANGWFLSLQRLMQIFGPLLGGMLLASHGFKACILVYVVTLISSLLFTAYYKQMNKIIAGELPVPPQEREFISNFVDSLVYVLKSPIFRPFVYLMFFWNLSSFLPNTPTITYYFTETHKFNSAQYGLLTALFSALGLVGYWRASYASWDRFQHELIRSSLIQAILGTIGLIFFKFPIPLALCLALSRAHGSSLTLVTFILRQTLIPREKSGAINACLRMLFMSAGPIAALLQGVLIPTVGVAFSLGLGILCLWGTAWQARNVARACANFKNFEEKSSPAVA